LVNIGNQSNFFSKIFSKLVKRELEIAKIESVTYSVISNNFVLHLPSEYDYFLCTPKKDEFIDTLSKIKSNEGQSPLKFYLVEDIDLNKYSKKDHEEDSHPPDSNPQTMTTD